MREIYSIFHAEVLTPVIPALDGEAGVKFSVNFRVVHAEGLAPPDFLAERAIFFFFFADVRSGVNFRVVHSEELALRGFLTERAIFFHASPTVRFFPSISFARPNSRTFVQASVFPISTGH